MIDEECGEMLARFRAGEAVVWYLTDNLGSVRDVADSTGAVVNHVSYDSFGRVLAQSAPTLGDRFLFTAREFDDETGLCFYRARYYSPAIGRFVSEDPVGFDAQDYNLHRYAANNPVSLADPSGTFVLFGYSITVKMQTVILVEALAYLGKVLYKMIGCIIKVLEAIDTDKTGKEIKWIRINCVYEAFDPF